MSTAETPSWEKIIPKWILTSRVQIVRANSHTKNVMGLRLPSNRSSVSRTVVRLDVKIQHEFKAEQTVSSIHWREGGISFDNIVDEKYSNKLYEIFGENATKDKVNGWPYWVQNVEYPICPKCGTEMIYLFQIDSEDNVPFMFGDVCCGHITQCPKHPDILAFAWACS